MIKEGFEPSPLRTSALSWRLRPLGHLTFLEVQIASHPFNYLQQRLLSRDTLPTQWTKMLETFKNV